MAFDYFLIPPLKTQVRPKFPLVWGRPASREIDEEGPVMKSRKVETGRGHIAKSQTSKGINQDAVSGASHLIENASHSASEKTPSVGTK
eukprot:gene19858-6990_t